MGWTTHPGIVITQENYKQEQNVFSTLVFYMQKDKTIWIRSYSLYLEFKHLKIEYQHNY